MPNRFLRVSALSSDRWIRGSPVWSSVIDFLGGLTSKVSWRSLCEETAELDGRLRNKARDDDQREAGGV